MPEKATTHASHQERGCTVSISSGQETRLIRKLKITESLSVHLLLEANRLNKCSHTSLWVKWRLLKCPGLWEWGRFAPLKSTHLISTSSLISLDWDHHRRGIFSFGQMCIDHFQNCFLVCRMNIEDGSVTPCSLRKSQTALWTIQTNRLKEKQAVYGATAQRRVAQHWHPEITGDR